VPDSDDPRAILAAYREALAPGSALVIAHGSRETEGMPTSHLHTARQMYEREVGSVTLRTKDEVEALFDGFDLVEPGVVWVPEWRPEPVTPKTATSTATASSIGTETGTHTHTGPETGSETGTETRKPGVPDQSSPRAGYAGLALKR
jgi:S-adenosyl methyltransferase